MTLFRLDGMAITNIVQRKLFYMDIYFLLISNCSTVFAFLKEDTLYHRNIQLHESMTSRQRHAWEKNV